MDTYRKEKMKEFPKIESVVLHYHCSVCDLTWSKTFTPEDGLFLIPTSTYCGNCFCYLVGENKNEDFKYRDEERKI
jgi:hypothetical protein